MRMDNWGIAHLGLIGAIVGLMLVGGAVSMSVVPANMSIYPSYTEGDNVEIEWQDLRIPFGTYVTMSNGASFKLILNDGRVELREYQSGLLGGSSKVTARGETLTGQHVDIKINKYLLMYDVPHADISIRVKSAPTIRPLMTTQLGSLFRPVPMTITHQVYSAGGRARLEFDITSCRRSIWQGSMYRYDLTWHLRTYVYPVAASSITVKIDVNFEGGGWMPYTVKTDVNGETSGTWDIAGNYLSNKGTFKAEAIILSGKTTSEGYFEIGNGALPNPDPNPTPHPDPAPDPTPEPSPDPIPPIDPVVVDLSGLTAAIEKWQKAQQDAMKKWMGWFEKLDETRYNSLKDALERLGGNDQVLADSLGDMWSDMQDFKSYLNDFANYTNTTFTSVSQALDRLQASSDYMEDFTLWIAEELKQRPSAEIMIIPPPVIYAGIPNTVMITPMYARIVGVKIVDASGTLVQHTLDETAPVNVEFVPIEGSQILVEVTAEPLEGTHEEHVGKTMIKDSQTLIVSHSLGGGAGHVIDEELPLSASNVLFILLVVILILVVGAVIYVWRRGR